MIDFGEIASQICVAIVVLACAGLVLKAGIRRRVAHGSSEPREPDPPEDVTNVNDSVWKLYSPPFGVKHDVDIIFFHGLQLGDFEDAFWKTWLAKKDDQVVWPQKWLPKTLPGARILSVSYNSSAGEHEGQHDMYKLGENLVNDIIRDSKENIGQTCPVFLVGHSLGGIVIKQFILSAIRSKSQKNVEKDKTEIARIDTFLGNFKGAFYYATPHGGSRVADLARYIPGTSPILGLLKTLSTETARINDEFRKIRANLAAKSYAIAENLKTKYWVGYWLFRVQVVEEASSRLDIDDYFTHPYADHFTVCKARNVNDPTVIEKLAKFVTECSPTTKYNLLDQAAVDLR